MILGLLATLLAGCQTWIQESTVQVPSSSFPQCVDAAIAKVPGVSIDRVHSTAQNIVLATTLQSGSRGPFAYITRLQEANNLTALAVRFGEWGMREPERERERIAPLLQAITQALERDCRM